MPNAVIWDEWWGFKWTNVLVTGPEGARGAQVKWTGIIQFHSWGKLEAVTYALSLTWNSSSQFHFKGLSSIEGGLNIVVPSSPLVSLSRSSSILSFPPSPTPPQSFYPFFSTLFLHFLFCHHLRTFLISPLPSPLLFFELEWTRGMRVTGTWTGGGNNKWGRKSWLKFWKI